MMDRASHFWVTVKDRPLALIGAIIGLAIFVFAVVNVVQIRTKVIKVEQSSPCLGLTTRQCAFKLLAALPVKERHQIERQYQQDINKELAKRLVEDRRQQLANQDGGTGGTGGTGGGTGGSGGQINPRGGDGGGGNLTPGTPGQPNQQTPSNPSNPTVPPNSRNPSNPNNPPSVDVPPVDVPPINLPPVDVPPIHVPPIQVPRLVPQVPDQNLLPKVETPKVCVDIDLVQPGLQC